MFEKFYLISLIFTTFMFTFSWCEWALIIPNACFIEYDVCADQPGFCKNSGSCERQWTTARCHCAAGYYGDQCGKIILLSLIRTGIFHSQIKRVKPFYRKNINHLKYPIFVLISEYIFTEHKKCKLWCWTWYPQYMECCSVHRLRAMQAMVLSQSWLCRVCVVEGRVCVQGVHLHQ